MDATEVDHERTDENPVLGRGEHLEGPGERGRLPHRAALVAAEIMRGAMEVVRDRSDLGIRGDSRLVVVDERARHAGDLCRDGEEPRHIVRESVDIGARPACPRIQRE